MTGSTRLGRATAAPRFKRLQRHETRMAWIASLWAAMAVLSTVVAVWDSGHLSP